MGKQDIIKNTLLTINVIDRMTLISNNITKEDIEEFCKAYGLDFTVGSHGSWTWISFHKDGEQIHSFSDYGFQPKKTTPKVAMPEANIKMSPMGWLTPTGEFIESGYGEHCTSAMHIIEKLGLLGEYHETMVDGVYPIDFVMKRGYILMHNPAMVGDVFAEQLVSPTGLQREYLERNGIAEIHVR